MTADATRVGDDSPWYATPAGALDVAPHYRLTEVGPIPAQWRDAPLGEVAAVRAGGTPHRSNPTYWGGDIPWVTTAEVNGRTITEAHEYITELGLARSAARLEEPGTVLVALYGQGPTRGRVATLAIRAATNQACAAIIAKAGLVPQFLFHFLAGSYERLRSLSNKGSQDNLSGVLLRQFLVVVPPPSEQRAIAEALSDVDGLLGTLEALIAKKRAIKQAAMQQLLTGKARLPGFSGEWETRRLGEIGEINGAGVDKKTRPNEVPVRLLNYLDVYHKKFLRSIDLDHVVSAKPDQARRCMVLKGDVFFTPTSEVPDDIGRSAVAVENIEDAAYSYHVVRLRLTAGWDLRFRAYAFDSKAFLDEASRTCEGSGTRYVITLPRFRALPIHFPRDVAEQSAIATILSNMDAEIAALEARRDKTRAIKQGMMQQLLTGRVRLVKPEAAANA